MDSFPSSCERPTYTSEMIPFSSTLICSFMTLMPVEKVKGQPDEPEKVDVEGGGPGPKRTYSPQAAASKKDCQLP